VTVGFAAMIEGTVSGPHQQTLSFRPRSTFLGWNKTGRGAAQPKSLAVRKAELKHWQAAESTERMPRRLLPVGEPY
jgi:hypothetical protein